MTWNTTNNYENEYELLLKKLEHLSNKFKTKVSQSYVKEMTLYLLDQGINSNNFHKLEVFILNSCESYPSIKAVNDILIEHFNKSSKPPVKPIEKSDCLDCQGSGYLFAHYKNKWGAICCHCSTGQQIKEHKKDMADANYVVSRGGRLVTYREYIKRKFENE